MPPDEQHIWTQVFGPLSQAIAFFGGLGGLVNALVTRKPWRETLRVVLVGVAVAFGLGTISPHVLARVVPEFKDVGGAALGILTASAFVVGLIAVALVERLMGHGGKP